MTEEVQEGEQNENIQDQTDNQESGTENVPESDAGEVAVDDGSESIANAPIPEGLDEELFDAETRTLKEQGVIERLKKDQEEIASYKKQANDMRRKLSKGADAPDTVEEYAENYVPDERYDYALSDEESPNVKHVNNVLKELDAFAYAHGMSVETCKDLKNLYMKYAEDVKILDGRTQEEQEKAREEYFAAQKKILGDNAEQIIRSNVKFIKEYALFDKDEKAWLMRQMDAGAVPNTFVSKIKRLFDGQTSSDIPMREVVTNGLADDMTLAREYNNPNTSDSRRMQILQQRIDAGRVGGLPLVQ